MFDETLRDRLLHTRTIAIIGAKDTAGQPVDSVGRYLMAAGYTVYPVHPVRRTVWGLPSYASLAGLPCAVDMVNLFRAPQFCADHAREILQLTWKPHCFWMQLGIRSPEAGRCMQQAGIAVVEDRCIMVEHRKLLGEQA
ncbi:MAG: CoA-binding protein [Desulfovibrionaceae bacterium]